MGDWIEIASFIVAVLSALGLGGNILLWFTRLEPRLKSIEEDVRENKAGVDDLKRDHGTQIAQNRRDISEMKSDISTINERTQNTNTTVERMWTFLQERLK